MYVERQECYKKINEMKLIIVRIVIALLSIYAKIVLRSTLKNAQSFLSKDKCNTDTDN